MSTTIGDLLIKLGADVASLRTDMAESRRVVSSAMADVQRSVAMARTALGAFAGALGAVSLSQLVNGVADAEAKLHDLNLTTGISVSTLSALDDLGRLSGTSIETLSSATVKLAKNMVGLDEDGKGAAQAVKALGLEFGNFRQLQPAEQLLQVAKAMDQFQDGTGKAAAAQMLFGREGSSLLPFLKDLAQQEQLVGSLTEQNAALADEYGDNLARLATQSEQAKRSLVNDLLPSLVSITSQLLEARKAYGNWFDALTDVGWNVNPFKSLSANATDAAVELRKLSEERERLMQQMADREQASGLAKMFAPARSVLQADIDSYTQSINTLEARLKYLWSQQSGIGGGRGNVNPGQGAAPVLDLGDPAAQKKAAAEAEKQAKAYAELIEKIRERAAVEEFEFNLGRKLSEGEKKALELMVQVRDGTLALSEARRIGLGVELERDQAAEKRRLDQQRELKWLEETRAENDKAIEAAMAQADAYREVMREAQALNATYGMTQEQLQALEFKRLRDAAATLEQRAAYRLATDAGTALAQAEQDQAAILRRTAAERDALARKQELDRTDPLRGASQGVRDYLREIESAGEATRNAVQRGASTLEDTLVDTFATGKLNASSFVDFVIREFLRLQVVRPLMQDLLGSSGSFFSLFGGGGGAGGTGMPTDAGSTPMLDVASAGSGASVGMAKTTVVYSPTISIDARSDVAQVSALVREGVTQGQKQLIEDLRAAGKV